MTADRDACIRVREVRFFRLPMRFRFPFRYGIASVSELPHLIVRAEVEVGDRVAVGMSADGLPPKWFVKNPDTTFEEDDLPEMQRVIARAAETAVEIGSALSFFDWWRKVYDAQAGWATEQHIAPLLAAFGVSLIERAVLDAVCRCGSLSLHTALKQNRLRIDPGSIRSELSGMALSDVIATTPADRLPVRQTIGLGDPLTAAELNGTRPDDGLPLTLEESLQTYGLQYVKFKLSGDFEVDHERLRTVAKLRSNCGEPLRFTLDGNELYRDMASFRDQWERHTADTMIREWFDQRLLFVEQPLHRDVALSEEVRSALSVWDSGPAMVIDESDADLGSLPRALELGYAGTSHKNCKGIVKGLLNAATIAAERAAGRRAVLSAEDLINVGPIALNQDLAMVACLGVPHVERNGHHFLAGLSMFSEELQAAVVRDHGDLYEASHGFAAVRIESGSVSLTTVNQAPFGVAALPDVAEFRAWEF